MTNSHPETDKVFDLRAYKRTFAKTAFGFVTLSQHAPEPDPFPEELNRPEVVRVWAVAGGALTRSAYKTFGGFLFGSRDALGEFRKIRTRLAQCPVYALYGIKRGAVSLRRCRSSCTSGSRDWRRPSVRSRICRRRGPDDGARASRPRR